MKVVNLKFRIIAGKNGINNHETSVNLAYESPDPAEIKPTYEPEFPSYQPPTPDLGQDPYDEFPPFPKPAFPSLQPDFDQGAFESYKSKSV